MELTYCEAIEAMKRGKKLARKDWQEGHYLWIKYIETIDDKQLGAIRERTPEGKIFVGWLPDPIDILTDDWIIIQKDLDNDLRMS